MDQFRPNSTSILLTALMMTLFSAQLHAQKTEQQRIEMKQRVKADKNVTEVYLSRERETPSSIFFDFSRPSYKAAQAQTLLRGYLMLRAGYDNLEPGKFTSAARQLGVQEFQQYFKGIPVAYSRYKALLRNDDVLMLAGSYYEVPENLSVTPTLTEAKALNIAKTFVDAKKYAWEAIEDAINKTTDPTIKQQLRNGLSEYIPKGQLVVVKDFTNRKAVDMRLAYKFNLYATEPLSRGYIYIDAHTGKFLFYDALIKHASGPTTVHTRYAGNRVIYTKQISGNDPNNGQILVSSHPANDTVGGSVVPYIPGNPTYVLIDDTRGKGIETYDANNVQGLPVTTGDFAIYAQGKSFTDVGNHWTLPEHKRSPTEGGAAEAENDDIAWDAHWGAEMVYDYWGAKHNRKSYDNQNSAIKSYVHYGPAYDNAFWNGRVMTYGDGSGTAVTGYKALTALDVCAHEIGHGVCSSTSDLAYELESGAMNEGLSDIWAACVENFAIKNVDPNLDTAYKPFFIGEQITLATQPLRRMDAPKLTLNPDTYGGVNWTDVNGCIPNLANDECGVHNNSGVINKWFYLLTCGSGNGSGPDAGYVVPGADDGMKDDTTGGTVTPDAIPYSVTGLGFNITEQLVFLTEVMLTSTATYAEARDVSIAVAKAYSGDPCGNIVQSVTNAWYAVGVGNKFTPPCQVTYGFLQTAMNVSEGSNGLGCSGTDTIAIPIIMPANSTATVTTGGTATKGVDYATSGSSFTHNGIGNKIDTFFIYLYNDGVIENTETITLTVSVTNTGSSSVNTSHTITITDDDVTPVIGSDSVTLLSENFESTATGFNLPSGWAEQLTVPEDPANNPTANGKNHWGVFMPGQPNTTHTLAVTGRIGGPVPVQSPDGTYLNTSTSGTIAKTPAIDARGLTNIKLRFDFTVQGEVDPNGTDPEAFGKFDYMELMYSYDGTNFNALGQGYVFASAAPTTDSFEAVLPTYLNNKRFYLGFQWYNDANAGGPVSVSIDNLVLKAVPTKIETVLNRTGSERINGAQTVYFYSTERNIIAKVAATGTHNYGCITAKVERAGTDTSVLYNDTYKNIVGDKAIRLMPTTNNATGSYSITLYFTEAEIAAIETATGVSRNTFFMYKTTASTLAGATSANTTRKLAAYTAIPGTGGMFTATFTTGFSAFALGEPTPVIAWYFRTKQSGNWNAVSTWEMSPDSTKWIAATVTPNINSNTVTIRNGHTVTVTAPVTIDQTVVQASGNLTVNSNLTVVGNLSRQ